jgi:hypothetical protein
MYLLQRDHRIVDVDTVISWPYGVEELRVTFEGQNIDRDHVAFMTEGSDLTGLITAFTHMNRALFSKQMRAENRVSREVTE